MSSYEVPKQFAARVPTSFNPSYILPEEYHEAIYWLVGHIWDRTSGRGPGAATAINAKRLQKILGEKKARAVIKALIKAGVIEVSRGYIPGKQSKTYRLTTDTTNCYNYRSVPIRDPWFIKRLQEDHKKAFYQERSRWEDLHYKLYGWLQSLSIDRTEAITLLRTLEEVDGGLAAQMIHVDDIASPQETRFTISSTGRVFTPVTSVKRELRSCMSVHGEELRGHDIKASQPTLLMTLLQGAQDSKFFQSSSRLRRAQEYGYLSVLNALAKIERIDLERFRFVVEHGDVYSLIQDHLFNEEGLHYSRDEIKLAIMRDVFAKRGDYNSEIEAAFKHYFGTVYDYIKQVCINSHSRLIRAMQWIESEVVIHGALLHAYHQKCKWMYTVHDSIYCTESSSPHVFEGFEEVSKACGVNIRIDKSLSKQEELLAAEQVREEAERVAHLFYKKEQVGA